MGIRSAAGVIAATTAFWAAAPAAGAEAGALSLTIDGNAAAEFTADCRVRIDGAWETHDFAGRPPFARQFDGDALACEIRQLAPDGRMTVVAESGSGSTSTLSVSGARSTANIHVE